MKDSQNSIEIELLARDPGELLKQYQSVVEIIVQKFITRGFFTFDERMDIIQQVNTALLEKKLASIQKHFKGTVLLKTYFSKVVYNYCLEIARSRKNRPNEVPEETLQPHADSSISAEQKMMIQDEINRLSVILRGIIGLSVRTIILFKLFARVPIERGDLSGKMIPEDDIFKNFRNIFFLDFDGMIDKEIYQAAKPFLDRISTKKTEADSLRKWVNMTIDKIILLQNGDPPRARHSRETIRILLQKYFEQENT